MLRKRFDIELQHVLSQVTTLKGIVVLQLQCAITQQYNQDWLIGQYDKCDKLSKEIHQQVTTIIAIEQPVASDLRYLLILLHVSDRLHQMSYCFNKIMTTVSKTKDDVSHISEQFSIIVNDIILFLETVDDFQFLSKSHLYIKHDAMMQQLKMTLQQTLHHNTWVLSELWLYMCELEQSVLDIVHYVQVFSLKK